MMDRAGWQELMTAFAAGRMDGLAFERRFLEAFRAQGDEPVPYAVDLTFYAVDAYCADPALRGPGSIDENELRVEVRGYLGRMDEPWPDAGGAHERNRQLQRWQQTLREAADGLGAGGKS